MNKVRVITDENKIKQMIKKVSAVGISINVALVIFKLLAGIIGHSGAMISDAVHSASDVLATFMAIIGVNMSRKAPDKDHPYGHDREECVASSLLSGVLLLTGMGIGYSGLEKIFLMRTSELTAPGEVALVAAAVSILTKEWMYHYTKNIALKINSAAFLADAWHHRSDALSSIGALIGIIGARMGYPVLDPLASVVICVFIIKVSFDIFREAINRMVDRACDVEFENEMREYILRQDGVLGIDTLHTRMFGNKIYVDVEILADGEESLNKAHAIAERVHNGIEYKFPEVKHVMVHLNPKN